MKRSVRNVAMDLLSRREHSRRELEKKLLLREFEHDEIALALDKLEAENLLNDARFAECYVAHRAKKGFGPVRIQHELSERGIDENQIDLLISDAGESWFERMIHEREKKFGQKIPPEYAEKMKQARFLQNRGFSPESVMRLFRR